MPEGFCAGNNTDFSALIPSSDLQLFFVLKFRDIVSCRGGFYRKDIVILRTK
jgi:hypothetical protein